MKKLSQFLLIFFLSFSVAFAKSSNTQAPILKEERILSINIDDKLSIKYPAFLKTNKLQNGWIRLFHTISYKHEQYQDGKYGVTPSNTYTNFDLRVKYYSLLENALEENHLNGYLQGYLDEHNLHGKALLESISQLDNSSIGPIQKVKGGYSIRAGVEGVGSYYYIIIKQKGVLLFDLPYNINPVKPLQKKVPLNILSGEDRDKLKWSILKSTAPINEFTEKEKLSQIKKIKESLQSTPLIIGTVKDIKEEFIPLGFNENKKFSYLSKIFSDGTGCNYFSFNIIDLSNDKNIVNMETLPDSCHRDDYKIIEKQFLLKVEDKLKEHKISNRNIMKLKKFPVVKENKKFDICLSTRTKEQQGQEVNTQLVNLIAYNSEGDSKKIGVFEEVKFGGSLQVFNPKIEGYFKNPNYDRLAVIVSYAVRGTDGSPNFRRVKIFGSTLTIKKGTNTNNPCAQSETRPDVGSIKKAKKALAMSLKKNTKIIKTEPIKTAKGSASFALLASMFGLLSLRLKKHQCKTDE